MVAVPQGIQNPAYAPLSAHNPVPNTKFEFRLAFRRTVSCGYQYPFSTHL